MGEKFSVRLAKAMNYAGLSQQDIIDKTGITSGAISSYLNDRYSPKQNNIFKLAKALNVSEGYLLGLNVPMEPSIDISGIKNIEPIPSLKKVPLLGTIAAGEPILAEENIEEYIDLNDTVKADFCLRVKGTSMIGAGIKNGDIIFIKQQESAEDGQIAAVLIEESATLKRVFRIGDIIQLRAENPEVAPINLNGEKNVRILGIATYRLSKV